MEINNNVQVDSNYEFGVGETAFYKCIAGYVRADSMGSNIATCQLDGSWSAAFIVCIDDNECSEDSTNDCPENSNCVNIDGGYTCECNDNYKPSGVGDSFECIGNYSDILIKIIGLSINLFLVWRAVSL